MVVGLVDSTRRANFASAQTLARSLKPAVATIAAAFLVACSESGDDASVPPPASPPPVAVNQAPSANAGPDQRAISGSTVTLSGVGSADPDGTIAAFTWVQTAGAVVSLAAPGAITTTFVAPPVSQATTLTFSLTVRDNSGATASDSVSVIVDPPTSPAPPGARTYSSAVALQGQGIVPRGLDVGPDGAIYSVGSFDAGAPLSVGSLSVSSGDGQSDIYLLVQGQDGSPQRLTAFGGGGGPDFSADISVGADGSAFLVGGAAGAASFGGLAFATGSPANIDAFVLKLAPDGSAEWVLRGAGPGIGFGNEIEIASNGDLVVTGSFQETLDFGSGVSVASTAGAGIGQAFVLRVSPDGSPLWARAVTGPVETGGRGVASDPINLDGDTVDRRVYLAVQFNGGSATVRTPNGDTTLTGPGGGGDCLISAFSSGGDLLYTRVFGGPGFDNCRGVGASNQGDVFVAGEFEGAVVFDAVTLTSAGAEDIYVARLDTSGNVTAALRAGAAGDDGGPEIEVDENGAAFFTGSFAGNATTNVGVSYPIAGAPRDVFIAEVPVGASTITFSPQSPGSGDDVSFALARGPNDVSAITGTFTNTLTFGSTTLTAGAQGGAFVAVLGSGSGSTPPSPPPPPPGGVSQAPLSLAATRLTDNGASRSVNVPVFFYLPPAAGTYPLIVWSHGGSASPQNVEICEFWASQGFIVAAPAHSDSAEQRANGGTGLAGAASPLSFVNRAADVSMILDRIGEVQAAMPVGYVIDASRPVVGGHSFGALTAMEIAGADWSLNGRTSNDAYDSAVIADTSVPDSRFRAGIFVSPAGTEQTYGLNNFNFVDAPFLGITGTRDTGPPNNPFPSGFLDRRDVFSSSANDGIGADDGVNDRRQYFVIYENATHFDFLGNNNRFDPDVQDITLRFLRGIVQDDAAAIAPLNDPVAYEAARPLIDDFAARP